MSRFFSDKYSTLVPYTPGEQPKERKYVKLNTNESPFPPSPLAVSMAQKEAEILQLYSDPEVRDLVAVAAACYGVEKDELLFTNGSDEILNFAFMAFCDKTHPAVFPNITYGFYPVFADLNGIPYETIPLKDDFTLCAADYYHVHKTIFIANPNAPTGLALSKGEIEAIVQNNPDVVVVIDEAYVDFGAQSVVDLIHTYDNLLVTQTFSKSRSLAGGRLGVGFGCKALIRDLNTVKYSTNPYNVNRMTMAAGIGALQDKAYFEQNCRLIEEVRLWTKQQLETLGFIVTDSKANFLFAKWDKLSGSELYTRLREKGILIRHFETPLLKDWNRITVGNKEQMCILLNAIKEIKEEKA